MNEVANRATAWASRRGRASRNRLDARGISFYIWAGTAAPASKDVKALIHMARSTFRREVCWRWKRPTGAKQCGERLWPGSSELSGKTFGFWGLASSGDRDSARHLVTCCTRDRAGDRQAYIRRDERGAAECRRAVRVGALKLNEHIDALDGADAMVSSPSGSRSSSGFR